MPIPIATSANMRQVLLAALAQVGRQAVHHDEALADRAATGLAPRLESPAGLRQDVGELLEPPLKLRGVGPAQRERDRPDQARITHLESLLSGHGPVHEYGTRGRSSQAEAREPRGAGRLELRPARQLGQGRSVEQLLADDPRLGDLRVADDRAELEMAVAEPAQPDQV